MVKVLIVDDELIIRNFLKKILEAEGFDCSLASDAAEATQTLRDRTFDLITLDIMMPGESGLDLLEKIKSEHPDTAVVMITLINDSATARLALERGAYGYIRKPIDLDEVIINIHNALRRRELEIERKRYLNELENLVKERTKDLVRSEERFRTLVGAMNEGVVVGDRDRRFSYVNNRFCEMLGYNNDQFIGQKIEEFVDDSYRRAFNTNLDKRRQGYRERYELVWKKKNGGDLVTIVSPSPLLDDEGKYDGAFGVITDITQIKKNEKALKRELEINSMMASTARKIVSSVSTDEISDSILNQALKLTKSEYGLVGYIDPDTGYFVVSTLTGRVWETCQISGKEAVFKKFSGLWGWVLDHRSPLWTNKTNNDPRSSGTPKGHVPIERFLGVPAMIGDRLLGMIGVANPPRDFREDNVREIKPLADLYAMALQRKWHEENIRRSENRLKNIINSISAGIMIVDKETHTITEINPSGAAIIGAPQKAIIGRECWQYICPADRNCCPITDHGKTVDKSEKMLINVHNIEVPIIKTVNPIEFDGREHLLETFIDISEQKHMEFRLAQARKLESLGQLAAGIAHEINTPTQYVGDNTRFLKEVFTDLFDMIKEYQEVIRLAENGLKIDEAIRRVKEAEKECDLWYLHDDIPKAIDQTLEGVDRISTIVQSMRQFAHSDRMSKSPIDLHKMIESTVIVARNEYKYLADLKTDFDMSLPPVPCFAGEFNQVILNLIINAAHAISDKVGDGSQEKGLIIISTKNKGDWAEIKVEDTGAGIPSNIRSRIFDPFFTTKEVGKGTGQGLAIAHAVIVEKHGGKIWFETQTGSGTTFFINLPLNRK